MPRYYYRKLVRDRIPELISGEGCPHRVRKLSETAYARALRAKILEEAYELSSAKGKKALLNELIDLQELVESFRMLLGIKPKSFQAEVKRKRRERGGFKKRLFLEYVDEL
ncbi:MAG: nucleoside triphosphate pyrophosphohydrolase [bacterium]|jgi:predicted house-cleaning noncanonical NTP pyrophosphatase (MazG superfamily)